MRKSFTHKRIRRPGVPLRTRSQRRRLDVCGGGGENIPPRSAAARFFLDRLRPRRSGNDGLLSVRARASTGVHVDVAGQLARAQQDQHHSSQCVEDVVSDDGEVYIL